MLHDLSRQKPRNSVTRSPAMCLHAPQLSPENLPCATSDSWLPNRVRAHAPPWRPPRSPIYRTWDSDPHLSLHALPRFLAYTSRASGLSTHLPRAEAVADVTWWCHHSRHSLQVIRHASPSTRQWHVKDDVSSSTARSVTRLGNLEPTRISTRWLYLD